MVRRLVWLPLLLATSAAIAGRPTEQRTTDSFTSEWAKPSDSMRGSESMKFNADMAQRMTVAVSVGGSGPYNFLVDTGSERTAISRQLAQTLQLEQGLPARVHSVLGSNTVQTVMIPRLAVGKQSMSVVDAPMFEAAHLGADGMLGIDSLKAQRVLFDFREGEMQITPSPVVETLPRDDTVIVVRARQRNGRLILTKVILDGVPIAAIIDTGAQVSIGNQALFRQLQRARKVSGRKTIYKPGADRAVIEAVTGDIRGVDMAKVHYLDLGGVELREVTVAFASAAIFKELGYQNRPALLLGMNAMRSFDKVAIDFAQKKVRFVLPSVAMRDGPQLAAR